MSFNVYSSAAMAAPTSPPILPPSHPTSTVKHLLGTRVAAVLDDMEKRLHGELTVVDRYVSQQHSEAAHHRLMREQQHWDTAASSSAVGSQEAVLEAGVQLLWEVTQELPDFRRKTIHVSRAARAWASMLNRGSCAKAPHQAARSAVTIPPSAVPPCRPRTWCCSAGS